MGKNKVIKSEKLATIKYVDLIERSQNKLNKSNLIVSTGTGAFKNKKTYNRKLKHKNKRLDYDRINNLLVDCVII